MTFPYKIVAVVGPTASGKTATAIQLAQLFNAEIVSVDSLQIYKYLDIGTGKASFQEQRAIPHHLLDIVTPDQHYDAAMFQKDADDAIRSIAQKDKNIILAGGAGLYLRALIKGLFEIPSDPDVRHRLKEEAHAQGSPALHRRLQSIDPISAEKISPNDPIRVVRALEVYEITGRTFSSWSEEHQKQPPRYRALLLGISPPRKLLFERINQRVLSMLREGWGQEVERLRLMGYSFDLKPLQSIGYREISMFFEGKLAPEELLQRIQRQTRLYAKRQLTWFRKENVHWFSSGQELLADTTLLQTIEKFLTSH